MFRNIKSTLIRRIFRRNIYKMSNKSTIETTTRIVSIYRYKNIVVSSNCSNNY